MKTSVDFIAWKTEDQYGNMDAGVVNEGADTVQVCGMENKTGESLYYEDDFHYLEKWCKENKVDYTSERRSVIL